MTVGDPAAPIRRVGLSPGFTSPSANRQIFQSDDVEALIIDEAHEWETIEYAVDAITAGKKKGLIVIGHIPSEEAGMEECARWLATFMEDVPIEFVATRDPLHALQSGRTDR